MAAKTYCTLVAGAKYLKNFDAPATDAQKGMTQADLTECEENAAEIIDLELGELYDTSGWGTSPPPLIGTIATMLASAEAMLMKFSRDGVGKPGEFVDWLEGRARAMLDRIRMGNGVLRDASGAVIAPREERAPRVGNREDRPMSGPRWTRTGHSDGR